MGNDSGSGFPKEKSGVSDDRLLLISDLLRLRGRVFEMEGESDAYRRITEAVEALKIKEEVRGEPVHQG